MIAAVLLAAGTSRRFGTGAGKLTQALNGVALIRWSAAALREPRIGEIIVVTGADDNPIRQALAGLDARFVVNRDPERGLGSSIACGVAALAPETRAAIITLGDEPFLDNAVLRAVLDRHEATGAAIVAPRFAGVHGHPVLFARETFAELTALDGDRGARSVVTRDPARVSWLDFPEPAPPDVDTQDDLALARARAQNTSPFTRTPH